MNSFPLDLRPSTHQPNRWPRRTITLRVVTPSPSSGHVEGNPSGASVSPSPVPCMRWLHSRFLRCVPMPATPVHDYQSDGDRGPHQRVQPAHPVLSCSSGPELTVLILPSAAWATRVMRTLP